MIIRKLFSKRAFAVYGLLFLFLLGMVWYHAGFQELIPDEVYGSHQMSADTLEERIKEHNIKSVINLRGENPQHQWYLDEKEVTEKLKIRQYDCPLSSKFLPPRKTLHDAIRALEESPKPVLIHCELGVDRTGWMCMCYLLLTDETVTPESVFDHLSVWRGHLPWREGMKMKKKFFQLYQDWLAERNLPHTPESFRNFVFNGYEDPPAYRPNNKMEDKHVRSR